MFYKKITSLLISCALIFCPTVLSSDLSCQHVTAAYEGSENPCNRQDDMEVKYDGSRWVQPPQWNCPTVNPRDYKGGIMIFSDKIGLEPEIASGKVQRFYVSVHGATEPVSMMKFHIFYDTRLKVKPNSDGDVMNAGKAVRDFDTGSAMVTEGELAFYAYSKEDIELINGSLFTIDFIIPENADRGEVYPIGISYVDDGVVSDTFINSAKDDAGKLQMTYVFTKGIYNGFIKMMGDKRIKGDVNEDEAVNTADFVTLARIILGFSEDSEPKSSDLNKDDKTDSTDLLALKKILISGS